MLVFPSGCVDSPRMGMETESPLFHHPCEHQDRLKVEASYPFEGVDTAEALEPEARGAAVHT